MFKESDIGHEVLKITKPWQNSKQTNKKIRTSALYLTIWNVSTWSAFPFTILLALSDENFLSFFMNSINSKVKLV